MADLNAINTLLSSIALRGRSKSAIILACDAMLVEDPTTANHAQHLTWASQALGQLDWANTKVFELLVVNPTITTAGEAATDGQVTAAVATICTTLSASGTF
jgi:hypothetical protein